MCDDVRIRIGPRREIVSIDPPEAEVWELDEAGQAARRLFPGDHLASGVKFTVVRNRGRIELTNPGSGA